MSALSTVGRMLHFRSAEKIDGSKSKVSLGRLTMWTFTGLLVTTLLIVFLGRDLVSQKIETAYVDIQSKTAADQAQRIAQLLGQELASGVPASLVQQSLQESLSRSPYDDAGFLCLVDEDATVICHPDVNSLGMKVPYLTQSEIPDNAVNGSEWIHGQGYAGETHLVVRHQVIGMPWQVSVHANAQTLKDRAMELRNQVTSAILPLLAGFVILGTFGARVAGRVYERRIEEMNRGLEEKVTERTVELETASHYHREIIEAAPSAIFLCDEEGIIRRGNSQAEQLTSKKNGDLAGHRVDELWTWEDGVERSDALVSSGAREAKFVASDGRERQLHVFTRTLPLKQGSEVMMVVQDVTELKTLEREFLQAQKMEAVGQLAGGVAHDFNNLLGAIMGFTELARFQSSDPEVNTRLTQSVEACKRAAKLSQQLLAFSRKQVLEPQVGTLPDFINETSKVLERVLGEEVDIQIHRQKMPWETRLDPMQFEQVLLNLAINARDAMQGRGHLVIRSFNTPAGTEIAQGSRCLSKDYVCIEVEDEGPGIPADVLRNIFEPFFTTKPTGEGTGLGLASVQGIVQQHGGHIDVRSELGGGTCFSIYFPRNQGASTTKPAIERGPIPGTGQGQHVMLVEDDPSLLDSLCGLLKASDYACTGFSSRQEALDRLQMAGAYDVVLCDVVMPGVSLSSFLLSVKTLAPEARIVLMSGYATGKTLEEAKAAGVPILQKPFTMDQLSAVLVG